MIPIVLLICGVLGILVACQVLLRMTRADRAREIALRRSLAELQDWRDSIGKALGE